LILAVRLLGCGLSLALVALLMYVNFVTIPAQERDECLQLVKTEESKFLAAFEAQVRADPKLEIVGWECELVHPWGLVTYLYKDSPDTNERKAYFWCVNVKTRKVSRLRSLAQFVDDYLLKEDESPSP